MVWFVDGGGVPIIFIRIYISINTYTYTNNNTISIFIIYIHRDITCYSTLYTNSMLVSKCIP